MSEPVKPGRGPSAEEALGSTLFPNYPRIADWYAREVEGLSEAQLDFDDDREEWMKWSIRRQVSHAAYAHFHWLVLRWAPQVFRSGDPVPELDAEAVARYDRCFDEETHRSMDLLLSRLREGVGMVNLILGRETVGEMRRKEVDRVVEPGARYPSGDSVLDFWRAAARVNPGIRADVRDNPAEPDRFWINLVGMVRQLYFECLLHLHTIQRLKRAQGLAAVVQIPREGYLLLPEFSGDPEMSA
ncbi:MAG: hypothetical protein ACE5JS_15065 [Nitrospinota bacterium]